jgi:WhiB family transcriptional regulator, redox-sensing transcriptional regulator
MSAATADQDWRQRSACKDEDPDIFFRESKRGIRQAKAICAACPVQPACLEWALDTGDRWSVAAGMTPGERSLLRVAMGRAA